MRFTSNPTPKSNPRLWAHPGWAAPRHVEGWCGGCCGECRECRRLDYWLVHSRTFGSRDYRVPDEPRSLIPSTWAALEAACLKWGPPCMYPTVQAGAE